MRYYGAGTGHALAMLGCFALAGYAGVRLLSGDWFGVAVWFVGAALVHDLVVLPIYATVGRALLSLPGKDFLQIPALLSALVLLVWYPLISGSAPDYALVTGLDPNVFATRWIMITIALFTVSALWAAGRQLRAQFRRSNRAGGSTSTR